MLSVELELGAGLLKVRGVVEEPLFLGVDGVVVLGVEGLGVLFGVENEREGDDVVFGAEKDRLPELKPLLAAKAGEMKTPSAKTTVTARARIRRTHCQDRMVPHPPGCIASRELPEAAEHFLLAFIIKDSSERQKVRGRGELRLETGDQPHDMGGRGAAAEPVAVKKVRTGRLRRFSEEEAATRTESTQLGPRSE